MYKPVKLLIQPSDRDETDQEDFQWKNVKNQYVATFSVSLIMFCLGVMTGWFPTTMPLMMSDDTPLASGPMTLEELSWAVSTSCVGALISILTFGFVTTIMGSKRAMTFLAIPAVAFWLIIIFADSFYHILIALFALGFIGGGSQSTISLYIADIANDNIRGKLGSTMFLARSVGILIAYIVGAVVSYAYIPYIFISIPILFLISFILLPNTPQYLLQKGKFEKAKASLEYYKDCRKTDSEHEKHALKIEYERIKSIATNHKGTEKVELKDIYASKSLKGFFIGTVLSLLQVFTGNFTIISYSVTICELSGMHMNPYVASIVLAIIPIIANFCTTQFVEMFGRKVVLCVSLFGTSFGLFSFSTYLYLDQHKYELAYFNWVPVTSLGVVVFMASAGVVPLATVCTVEHLPPKVRTIEMNIFSVCLIIFAFLSVKFFPILIGIIELYGCMMIFGVVSFLGIFFVYFVMEETNGKRLDATDSKETVQVEIVGSIVGLA